MGSGHVRVPSLFCSLSNKTKLSCSPPLPSPPFGDSPSSPLPSSPCLHVSYFLLVCLDLCVEFTVILLEPCRSDLLRRQLLLLVALELSDADALHLLFEHAVGARRVEGAVAIRRVLARSAVNHTSTRMVRPRGDVIHLKDDGKMEGGRGKCRNEGEVGERKHAVLGGKKKERRQANEGRGSISREEPRATDLAVNRNPSITRLVVLVQLIQGDFPRSRLAALAHFFRISSNKCGRGSAPLHRWEGREVTSSQRMAAAHFISQGPRRSLLQATGYILFLRNLENACR